MVFADRKINYDFLSTRHSLFDLRADPGEQTDLMLSDPYAAPELREAVHRYRQVRASRRNYVLAPQKTPLPPSRPRR
jgi:hypothetical protein